MYRLLIIVKVFIGQYCKIGVSKKTKKPRKPGKKITKKTEQKKTRLNRLKFWKNRSVQFGFISKKLKKPNRTESKPEKNRAKTEPNQKNQAKNRKNRAKIEKTKPNQKNRAKPVWTGFCPKKPNRTETGRFDPVSVQFWFFFLKKFGLVIFFYKNRTEQKMITPIAKYRGRFNFLYLYLLVNCHHKKKRYYWPWSHILIFMYFNDNN